MTFSFPVFTIQYNTIQFTIQYFYKVMALRVGTPVLGFETEHITLGPLVSASTESGNSLPLFFFSL